MISISVSILGFWIIKYEFAEIFRDFGLKKVFFHPTLLLLAFLMLITLKKFYHDPILNWIFTLIVYFLVYFLPLMIKKKFETEIKDQILFFLDNIILNVQSGIPMRSSLAKASDDFTGWKKTQFKLLVNSIHLGQKNDHFQSKTLKKFHREIVNIENSKTKNFEQLKSYRQQLKIEQNLRHRSRQVTMNLKIQSLVMTILYFLIGFFIFSNFDTSNSKSVLLFSVFFFSLGQILVFFIGKSLKWKT